METSNKTARELYEAVKADPNRQRFGFGPSVFPSCLQRVSARTCLVGHTQRKRAQDYRACSSYCIHNLAETLGIAHIEPQYVSSVIRGGLNFCCQEPYGSAIQRQAS